ncbi:MAG: DegT/DnrJ/EryC1/StrS family aminotransferase [Kiritimatiellae bacterium]|nr:DegT/DnrJ/EryC1/StrS family aminotransferase [Verrucomicrobiota bacterium]MCG2661603.1 DegT/DnrJ/EryC1/StrS family aminotransferase [Kiritimatiellia bacterium]
MYRLGQKEIDEVSKVIKARKMFRVGDPKTGHLQEANRFEKEWAHTIGVKHALLLSGGGTAGLMAGLAGMGIGPGDEVIVPGYTFMATAAAVLMVGAIPVIAEINETLTLDPRDVEKKIGPHTKAIIPVHMCGIPADMKTLTALARKHKIKVLEDCCQADGGSFRGKRLGSWGQAGAYSFNDFKIMSAGEGGALVTNDDKIFERAGIYSDSGTTFRPYVKNFTVPIFLGFQFRSTEIMGAILRMQLQRLAGMLADLRRIRARFVAKLKGNPGIRFAPSNDPKGDCGVVASFQFKSEALARAFAKAEGVGGWLPIDSGKHVYSNWDPILKHRVGHSPGMNPYRMPNNKGLRLNYTKNMCPRTLDILKRTVFISLHPDWTEAQVRTRIAVCRKAGASL